VSILGKPAVNGTKDTRKDQYRVQIGLSWLKKGLAMCTTSSNEDLVAEMEKRAKGFHSTSKRIIDGIKTDSPVQEIIPPDWPCLDWVSNANATLAGDAAYLMTMYRGEAANHGFLDALLLCRTLQSVHVEGVDLGERITTYEDEMREGTTVRVRWC
jgi:2-polyprenyl-6-methoxyphenol hydroxylase-like FAD-dependent oxidoreductase